MNRQKETWKYYGISEQRANRLLAELIVYLALYARCECNQHLDEEKIVSLMEHWPGSALARQERHYLYRVIGQIMFDRAGCDIVVQNLQFVAEWNVIQADRTALEKERKDYYMKLFEETKRQERIESIQHNPDLN